MNWLDTQTKEILQKNHDPKPAPSKVAEFALVLIRKGADRKRLVRAITQINKCSDSTAEDLAGGQTPVTINHDLTEGEALWGQFELICCDAISIFIRSEVLLQNDWGYLWPLFQKASNSVEFRLTKVSITKVPTTESGEKFVDQFLGGMPIQGVLPVTLDVPFKKARIMNHWAIRVGVQIQFDGSRDE